METSCQWSHSDFKFEQKARFTVKYVRFLNNCAVSFLRKWKKRIHIVIKIECLGVSRKSGSREAPSRENLYFASRPKLEGGSKKLIRNKFSGVLNKENGSFDPFPKHAQIIVLRVGVWENGYRVSAKESRFT